MNQQFSFQGNGTLTHLRGLYTPKPNLNILFPEQDVVVRGKTYKRGGAPVCCPNFGETSQDDPCYEGIELPRHGLVRKSSAVHVTQWPNGKKMYFRFTKPWRHNVTVEGLITRKLQFIHKLHVHYDDFEKESDALMPLSIAFHPYTATHGEPFWICYGKSLSLTDQQLVPGESLLVRGTGNPNDSLQISFRDYAVHFKIAGIYKHYCIWSDDLSRYICVEPFFGKKFSDPYFLKNHETCTGVCIISVS